MKRVLCVLLVLTLLVLSGCEDVPEQVQIQEYESISGYNISVPADWSRGEDTMESASFSSAEGDVILTVDHALGAMEYASLREIGDELQSSIGNKVYEFIDTYYADDSKTGFRFVIGGTDYNGNLLTTEGYIFSPYPAVRYYFVFTTSTEDYESESAVINDVILSIKSRLSDDEMYRFIQEYRDEQLAAELEKLTNDQALPE